MNERSLHQLFSRIVILALPLAAEAGCGGATSIDEGAGTGGTESGGSGGATTGGTSGGGLSTGGVLNTGGVGGNPTCQIGSSNIPTCIQPRTGTIPRACVTGTLTPALCQSICGSTFGGTCEIVVQDATTTTMRCPPSCVAGRRPPGFVSEPRSGFGLSAHFARAAELEHASVAAFRRLRAELRLLGAPRRLLRALSRSARDEQRHTRATRALARRFGARALPARVTPTPPRSLEAIALENVTEGCVRELYGALVATFQASTARDGEVRGVMARIAREETRHAALSFRLQRWLEARLDRDARLRVAAAKSRAVSELHAEILNQAELPDAALAGLPSAHEAKHLFQSLAFG